MSMQACASVIRCACKLLKFFFSIRFVISSEPGALSGASLPIARSSCCCVMNDVGSGYMCVAVMSEVSAGSNDESVGRRTSLN